MSLLRQIRGRATPLSIWPGTRVVSLLGVLVLFLFYRMKNYSPDQLANRSGYGGKWEEWWAKICTCVSAFLSFFGLLLFLEIGCDDIVNDDGAGGPAENMFPVVGEMFFAQ